MLLTALLLLAAVQAAAQSRAAVPLEGLYVAMTSGTQLNVWTNRLEMQVAEEYYLFFPDGRVYNDLPKGGRFDYAESLKRDPKNTGVYRFAGNEILFRWASGNTEHFTFARRGGNLEIGGQEYYRIGRFDGLRLQGVYGATSHAEVQGGAMAGQRYIAFSRDGRFQYKSAAGAATGTYEIVGNRLVLSSASGASDITFFILPENAGEAVPRLIYLDGRPFLLQR